jgi:hypothetical protein
MKLIEASVLEYKKLTAAYQPVVQVLIRALEVFRYPQGL